MHPSQVEELVTHQREFFGAIEEFFGRATGKVCTDFQSGDEIGNFFRQNAGVIGSRGEDAFTYLQKTFAPFYSKHSTRPFKLSRELGGVKLVLGGSSSFLDAQLNAVKKTLLYADTILIPDPLLPWFESKREGEAFRFPRTIQAAWSLLRLKPLVDAALQYPAVLVFPSWEKSLEEHDESTRDAINKLVIDAVSSASGRPIETLEQLRTFAEEHADEFLNVVEQHALFVAPNGVPGEPLKTGIAKYKEFVNLWRESSHAKKLLQLPDSAVVLIGMVERFSPQFHLQENSQELKSHPLLCLPVHTHYWKICCSLSTRRLQRLLLLENNTLRALEAINNIKFAWLGNVPINALVELRKNNENEDFRRQLNSQLNVFHDATVEDMDKVTAEVARSIESLLTKHQQEISKIEKKYAKLHTGTAAMSWATAAAMYAPVLAPYVGIGAPLAMLAKYGWDKLNEREERRKVAQSLMGVLAHAYAQAT